MYTITFTGAWTTMVTSGGLPSGAHFSRLIGGVHNDEVTFLESGEEASAGVESMAEVGGYTTLKSEITAAGDDHLSILEGTSDTVGPMAAVTFSDVTLSTDHPRVTVVTMIAPSPDWFVGVSGLSMLDSSGGWKASVSVDLYPWDAGTEEGTEFSLSNTATSPKGDITSLQGVGKFNSNKIATLTFTRTSVLTAAPTITAAHPGDEALTVVWTAPSGVTGITAYDLRWILTSADETVESNWSGGGGRLDRRTAPLRSRRVDRRRRLRRPDARRNRHGRCLVRDRRGDADRAGRHVRRGPHSPS